MRAQALNVFKQVQLLQKPVLALVMALTSQMPHAELCHLPSQEVSGMSESSDSSEP